MQTNAFETLPSSSPECVTRRDQLLTYVGHEVLKRFVIMRECPEQVSELRVVLMESSVFQPGGHSPCDILLSDEAEARGSPLGEFARQ